MKQDQDTQDYMVSLAQKIGFANPHEYCARSQGKAAITHNRHKELGNCRYPSWAWRSVNTLASKANTALIGRFIEAYKNMPIRTNSRDRMFTIWIATIALRSNIKSQDLTTPSKFGYT